MSTKTFDGTSNASAEPLFDGSGGLTRVSYDGPSVEFQKQVVIQEDTSADLPVFFDSFGHHMFGIEAIDASDKRDRIEISYALADRAGIVVVGDGALGPIEKYYLSIDLNGGNDELSIGDEIPLVPRASKNRGAEVDGGGGNDTIEGGKLRDHLLGSEGNDVIRGNGGDDILTGENGNDRIYGGDGNDTISCDSFTPGGSDMVYGGKGADTVNLSKDGVLDTIVFEALSDSPKADLRDSIFYFEAGIDEIDLSEIDAIAKTAKNDAFTVVKALDGKAGELTYTLTGGTTAFPRYDFVGDVNGDGKGDLFFSVFKPSIEAGAKIPDWFDL